MPVVVVKKAKKAAKAAQQAAQQPVKPSVERSAAPVALAAKPSVAQAKAVAQATAQLVKQATAQPPTAVTAEQAAKPKKRRWDEAEEERIEQTLRAMLARFPEAFDTPPGRPLKIGIAADLKAAFPDTEAKTVSRALGRWMGWRRSGYLRALIAGGPRYDLAGNPCGTVTEEQQLMATQEHAAFRKRTQAERQKPS